MQRPPLLKSTSSGLYCEAGDFYIDPWKAVPRAVVTHAHSDHATWGCDRYLTSETGRYVLQQRVQKEAKIETLPWSELLSMNGVRVSLHPAGHLLGSAQVRVEHEGEVWVVSGDYKVEADVTCEQFEVVRCHTFITESTFGLPIYRWRESGEIFAEMNRWWQSNQAMGRTSVIFAYALGKAQRVLAGLDAAIGPIVVHGSVMKFVEAYRAAGIVLPEVIHVTGDQAGPELFKQIKGQAMVIAPGSTLGTPWLRRFAPYATAMASGWMTVRGRRRHRSLDRGFVISDHVDWPGLLETIDATGAERIGITHGQTEVLARYLREEKGLDSFILKTRYEGEVEE